MSAKERIVLPLSSSSLGPFQFLSYVATSQFDSKLTLNLGKNLRIGSGSAILNVLEDRLLLVDLYGKVLLGHTKGQAGRLHSLSNGGVDLWRGSNFVVPIEFCNSLVVGALVSLVDSTSSPFIGGHDGTCTARSIKSRLAGAGNRNRPACRGSVADNEL